MCKRLISLARPEGLEPPTYRFEACRSIQLSYGRARVAEALTEINQFESFFNEKPFQMLGHNLIGDQQRAISKKKPSTVTTSLSRRHLPMGSGIRAMPRSHPVHVGFSQ